MVEGRRRPGRRAVTYVALLWQSSRHVIGIGGSLEILKVAIHASRAREVVVSVGVALRALHIGVGAGERPSGGRMIESRASPGDRAVANLALLRESRRSVTGIVGPLVVLQVARNTCRIGQVKVPIRVTLLALQLRVASGQRETYRVVIEVRRLPSRRAVALLAVLWQPERQVVRIARFLVVRHVAAYAGCGGALILPAHVAGGAVQGRVHSS